MLKLGDAGLGADAGAGAGAEQANSKLDDIFHHPEGKKSGRGRGKPKRPTLTLEEIRAQRT